MHAMVHLARNVDIWPIAGRKVAEETGIPPSYLAAILRDLARANVLESSPGPAGVPLGPIREGNPALRDSRPIRAQTRQPASVPLWAGSM